MPKFMLLLGGTDPDMVRANREQSIAQYTEWTQQLVQAKVFSSAHKLKDGEGRRLKLQGTQVIDGPFSETKETIGGYYIIEVADYAAAVAFAKDCPILTLQGGFVEVRRIER